MFKQIVTSKIFLSAVVISFWVIFGLLFFGVLVGTVGAYDLEPAYPEGVDVFEIPSGQTCVKWPDGSGDCYCPCDAVVDECTIDQTPTPPTETPPPPTDRPNCNRGIGNGSEDCDPGNSYGQGHGGGRRAGEDREE